MVRRKEASGTSLPVRNREVPGIPLPEPGDNSWEDLAQISERFRQHTAIEIKKRNRLQASEKVWASVSYSLAAVAEQRGWEYDTYHLKREVARQVGTELADANSPFSPSTESQEQMEAHRDAFLQDFLKAYDRARLLHDNFRQNDLSWPDIGEGQRMAATFLGQLAEFREKGYGKFTPINQDDQRRLVRLNGLNKEFRKVKRQLDQERYLQDRFPRYVPIEWRREPSDDDDKGAAPPAARPPSGSPPPTGGPAKFVPKSGQGSDKEVHLKLGRQGTDAAAATPPPKGRRPRRSRSKDAQSPSVNIQFG